MDQEDMSHKALNPNADKDARPLSLSLSVCPAQLVKPG